MKVQDLATAARYAERITELQLIQTDVKALPALLPALYNLRRLTIENCGLRRLPDSIGQCTNLDTLILNRNRLTELPDALGHCTRLFHLSIVSNRLSALPESLTQCLNLREVNLSRNQLAAWPAWISRLLWLARLNLSHNRIAGFPDMQGAYRQLECLDLGYNQLSSLPEQVVLPRLKTLLLSRNAITGFPEGRRKLPALEILDISNNPIPRVSEWPLRLKKLNISGCPLSEIPSSLLQLDQLRDVRGINGDTRKKLLAFLAACRRKPVPLEWRSALYSAFSGDEAALATLKPIACVHALAMSLPVLRERIIAHLTTKNAPKAGAKVACVGRFSVPLSMVYKRLVAAGMAPAPAAQAQWIAIGRPPYALPAAIEEEVVFVNEQTLFGALDGTEAKPRQIWSEEQTHQLRRLLTHSSQANVALAVRIIQGAGMPHDLHTELLFAWMQAPAGALKKELRSLLERHIPENSRHILRLPLKIWIAKDALYAEALLTKTFERTHFDARILSSLFYSKT